MKSYKSKKVKIGATCLAVILVACVLIVSMTGCKSAAVGVTSPDVFFVGNFQKNVTDDAALSSLMADGTELVGVKEMLDAEGWTLGGVDDLDIIAGIYALAVTNYSNVTRSGYMVMTDASVNAFNCSNLAGKDVNVGIRSTYSDFTGPNGTFSQTVAGVTVLDGLGSVISSLKDNFGWNTQSFSNSKFNIAKKGFNSGAEFYGKGNNEGDALKYIMGAGNPGLDKTKKGVSGSANKNTGSSDDDDEFESDRLYAWEELDRFADKDPLTVAGTDYYTGTYGTSWATSNYSVKQYFDAANTSVTYDAALDLYTLNIVIADEYVDTACEFTKGGLVKDTKDYIALKNAKYTKSQAKVEVYGSGLIKSMQKIDTLESKEASKLTVASGMFGECKNGGKAENRITMAFSYDVNDCDALKYVALYWPELATEAPYKKAKIDTGFMLDLSAYDTFSKYKPKANDLSGKFNSLYSFDWSTYSLAPAEDK